MSKIKKDEFVFGATHHGYTAIQYAIAGGMMSVVSAITFVCLNTALRKKILKIVASVSG